MEPTDIQLMLRVRQGDLDAYRLLVQRYRKPIHRFLSSLLGDAPLADDATQETFLRLWLLRDRYEPLGKFSTYLFQIARHHALNVRKQMWTEARHCNAEENLIADFDTPERAVLRDERDRKVRNAILALPPIYRAVFDLSHRDGLKYAEIANQLGIPIGTVKSRMAEAVRKLRKALEEGNDE